MKRLAFVGKSPWKIEKLKNDIKKHGFIFTQKNPQLIISYGGDGTFLLAERLYPGIPKLLIKDSKICKKCHENILEHEYELLLKKKVKIHKWEKLEANVKGKKLYCINDFTLRNENQMHAIRFKIFINNKKFDDEFIGDGVVIATHFGSSAYFHSITKETFTNGIGIAFNNITKDLRSKITKENSRIKIVITRGPVVFSTDNDPNLLRLNTGDIVEIKKSSKTAKTVTLK